MDPVELLILQPTSFCNIDCKYCFLADRDRSTKMSEEVLERSINAVFDWEHQNRPFKLVFHLGEPLVAGIEFVQRAVSIAKQRSTPSVWAEFNVQTNGMLIDQAWCDLFCEHDFKIGVSIDGPHWINDKYRVDRRSKGTLDRTLQGVKLLQENDIDFQILAVLTPQHYGYARETYEFFKSLNPLKICFNLEEIEGENEQSATLDSREDQYSEFWSELISIWLSDNSRVRIREFDQVLANVTEFTPLSASHLNQMSKPFRILTIAVDGSVLTFAPELISSNSKSKSFKYGNVLHSTLAEIAKVDQLIHDACEIAEGVKACHRSCKYFNVCGGGSPSNKFFEMGSLSSSKTKNCHYKVQLLYEAVIPKIEAWSERQNAPAI